MKKIIKKTIKKILDKAGITLFSNRLLPVGADYRKTIRQFFDIHTFETIFDVGANKGQFCLQCEEIFKHSKIYSFEPILKTFDLLKKNTEGRKNIQCFQLAFGDAPRQQEIFIQERSVFNSLNPATNFRKSDDQRSEIVNVVTIDSFCKENNIGKIDLLKIDAEGFDLNVLKGATQLMTERKILFILIEVTFDEELPNISPFDTIDAFLRKYNYRIHGFYNQSIYAGSTRMNYTDALFYLQSPK